MAGSANELPPLKVPTEGLEFSVTKQFKTIHGDPNPEFTAQIAARFGQKYKDIVRKYGAVEYILNDNHEIIDVMAPEEYLAESDDFAIQRFISGEHNSQRYSISAAALMRLAEAESQFWATQYLQLRNEPGYLRQRVEEEARTRPELVPDASGNAPTPEQLLNIPRFVGQQTRYLIQNILMHLGTWRVVAEYLKDIAILDEKEGRLGAKARRAELMACVKCLIEQEIGVVSKRILFGIMFHAETKSQFTREFNHEDWGGARFDISPDLLQKEVYAQFIAANLNGALMRFCSEDLLRKIKHPRTSLQLREDLLLQFSNAAQTELDGLSDQLYDALTQYQRLHDFGEMLGHPEEVGLPSDARYVSFAMAGRQAEAILTKTLLEKHLKSIESLEKPAVFAKIWKDIDVCSHKVAQKPIELVVGFAPPVPRWFSPAPAPRAAPEPAPAAPEELPEVEIVDEPTPPPTRRRPRPPPKADPAPADIKPYWSRAELPKVVVPAPRTGPKVKTRKAPVASTSSGAAAPSSDTKLGKEDTTPQELPVFWVGKRVLNTFARLFSGGKEKGDLNFEDFLYAMTSIGFSLIPKGGSIVTFISPIGKNKEQNKHFVCHRPHGQRDTLDTVRLREYAASLSESYGWTAEWFGFKADGPSESDK